MWNKLKTAAKIIAALVVIVVGIWFAVAFNANIGSILRKLLGGKFGPVPDPVDLDGLPVGKTYIIKENSNPLRDKSVAELSNGTVVQLPDSIVDTEVAQVIVVSQGVINVVKKDTGSLTGIFDDPVGGG